MARPQNYDKPLRLLGNPTEKELLVMLDGATRAVRAKPGSAMRHCNRAFLLLRLGRGNEALEAADEAVGADPHSADAQIVRGMALTSLGRIADALLGFERAIELDPTNTDARSNRASMLMGLGRHGEAVEELDRAIGAGPKRADAHVNRGRALHRLGRRGEAIESMRRAVAIRHRDASAWFDLGAMLFQAGSMGESLEAFEAAIRIQPAHVEAHRARAMALHILGRQDEAREAFARVRELVPAFVSPALPDEVDDIYVTWCGAVDIRNRLASPTSPRYVLQHQIRTHVAEFLNAARRVLEYHAEQRKSGIVDEYLGLGTRAKQYLQLVNTTKHERLLDVRITKTGRRKRVYPNTLTGQPMITIEEGARLVRDGKNYDIDTWPDDMFGGDVDRGFVYEEQECHVVLEDGEVELVEFMDTILEGVKDLLERHGYDTSALADTGPYYGEP